MQVPVSTLAALGELHKRSLFFFAIGVAWLLDDVFRRCQDVDFRDRRLYFKRVRFVGLQRWGFEQ